MRTVDFQLDVNKHAEGSVIVSFGDTRVHVTATVEERVPPFLRGKGMGWVTAEYAMLPRATGERIARESVRGKQSGRTLEISRLIGRALRSVVNGPALGERTILLDCDVLQADGGTRTAAITGAFVALALAVWRIDQRLEQPFAVYPLADFVAAVSVGIVGDELVTDLDYAADSSAAVDMNIVMTGRGTLVEVQGTGEERPYERSELDRMLDAAAVAAAHLVDLQRDVLGEAGVRIGESTAADAE